MYILHTLVALAGISVAVLAVDCTDPKATAICGTACCVPGLQKCGTDDKGADTCIPAIPNYTAGPHPNPHPNPPNASTTGVPSGTGTTWVSANSTGVTVIPTSVIVVNGTTILPSSNGTTTITSSVSSVSATTTFEGSTTSIESTTSTEMETSSKVSTQTVSSDVPSPTGGAVASIIPAGAVGAVFAAVLGAL